MKKVYTTVDGQEVIVEEAKTAREVLGYMDEYLNNLAFWTEGSDIDVDYITGTHIEIRYEDGSEMYIDSSYDAKTDGKIKRQHIKTIIYDGFDGVIVKGDYMVSEFGMVHAK